MVGHLSRKDVNKIFGQERVGGESILFQEVGILGHFVQGGREGTILSREVAREQWEKGHLVQGGWD